VASFRLRIALPDRPGALGAVASRIGAVRGDVVSVEIVERAQERAVDEFVVALGDEDRLPLLLSEISEVDGVSIEEIHPIAGTGRDRRLDAYDTAIAILQERTPHDVLGALAARVLPELDAAWSAVLDVEDVIVIASAGRPPAARWLVTYLDYSRGSGPPARGRARAHGDRPRVARLSGRPETGDVGWVDLAAWDLVLLAGRPGWRLGESDWVRLDALARLADARWVDLAEREARMSHPSRAG
jgi:hypothetical protein